MIGVIWRKIWRDLGRNKLRSLLAILSITVGMFALGLVLGLSGVMRDRMTASHRATLPAHIDLWGGPFDLNVVDAVLREPGVVEVEPEIITTFRWKIRGEPYWREGQLIAREAFDKQRVNVTNLVEGSWPARHGLAIERQSSRYFGLTTDEEGLFLGVLSWFLAVPLSYPGARFFSKLIGDTLMDYPLDFGYSISGMLFWLLIVLGFSVLASLWPALYATQISVQETLAHE